MYDPALKRLIDQYPGDFLDVLCRLTGLPTGQPAEVVQPNLPPRTVDADRAFRLINPGPMVLHIEFETSHELGRPDRFLVYNVLLSRQEQCPVKTVVLLMRPDAVSSDLTGVHRVMLPTGEVVLEWNYNVLRVWELSPDVFMGHPGTMALALIAAVAAADLQPLIERVAEEFLKRPTAEANELGSEAYLLFGLRHNRSVAARLIERIPGVKESDTYQAILEEGESRGVVRTFIEIAQNFLGPPDATTVAAIKAVHTSDRWPRVVQRVGKVRTWAELLGD